MAQVIRPWQVFVIAAAGWISRHQTDFFTIEVWGLRGLVAFYLLIVMELSTLRVHLAGVTPNPNTAWMMRMGRNLTAPDGVLAGKRFIRSIKSECLEKMIFFDDRSLLRAAAFFVTTSVKQRSYLRPSHTTSSLSCVFAPIVRRPTA